MQTEATKKQRIIVTGATSLIGHFLLPKLDSAQFTMLPCTRSSLYQGQQNWHQFDGQTLKSSTPTINEADILIHLGPLRTLPSLIESFSAIGGKRVIAFSSTSRFSKLNSGNASERQLAEALINAEETVVQKCVQTSINWTIFRPTLIYGAGLDKNVSSITRFIQRFGFFPLVGKASGLRQPVHADDLAAACVAIIDNEKTYGKAYDLTGMETLSYKTMIERIFKALGKKPRYLSFPLPLFRFAMKLASFIPSYSHVTADMANRMNEDLCFKYDEAVEDFGFINRDFSPQQVDLVKKPAS